MGKDWRLFGGGGGGITGPGKKKLFSLPNALPRWSSSFAFLPKPPFFSLVSEDAHDFRLLLEDCTALHHAGCSAVQLHIEKVMEIKWLGATNLSKARNSTMNFVVGGQDHFLK